MEVQEKVRILHIVDSNGLGGAQVLIRNHIARCKHYENHVFYLRKKPGHDEKEDNCLHYAKHKNKFTLKPFNKALRLIDAIQPALVHCHLTKSLAVGLYIKQKKKQLPIVYHEHGGIFLGRQGMQYRLHRVLLRLAKKRLEAIIAVSRETATQLEEKAGIPKHKLHLIENYIVLPEASHSQKIEALKQSIGLDEQVYTIGFAGRLTKQKNLEVLIAALSKIAFPIKLLIAGEGEERKNLERLAYRLKVTEQVVFLGYQKELSAFYQLLDCYVQPSAWEPFGLTLFEAMSMNVPVVASDILNHKHHLEERTAGLLFQVKNSDDLAEKLTILQKDDELKDKLIRAGRLKAAEFTYEKFHGKIEHIYRQMLAH